MDFVSSDKNHGHCVNVAKYQFLSWVAVRLQMPLHLSTHEAKLLVNALNMIALDGSST